MLGRFRLLPPASSSRLNCRALYYSHIIHASLIKAVNSLIVKLETVQHLLSGISVPGIGSGECRCIGGLAKGCTDWLLAPESFLILIGRWPGVHQSQASGHKNGDGEHGIEIRNVKSTFWGGRCWAEGLQTARDQSGIWLAFWLALTALALLKHSSSKVVLSPQPYGEAGKGCNLAFLLLGRVGLTG